MLESKYCCRNQNRALLALRDTLESRPQRYLRFAESHIAAEKTVHGYRSFHIPLYLVYAAQLVVGLVILKPALEVTLHIYVGRESKARCGKAFCVKFGQFFRHIVYGAPDLALCLLPAVAAETVELYRLRIIARTYVF